MIQFCDSAVDDSTAFQFVSERPAENNDAQPFISRARSGQETCVLQTICGQVFNLKGNLLGLRFRI